MNRAISGVLTVQESGRPATGLRVVAAKIEDDELELLGDTTSGPGGRFRIDYPLMLAPVDLTIMVFSAGGNLVYREPVHRGISGAELQIRVSIPLNQIAVTLN